MVQPPTFRVVEFDITSATSGQWLGFLDTTTRALDFGQVDNSQSGVVSSTKVIAMSGVEFNGNTTVEDIRFYLVSTTAINVGDVRYLQELSNTWNQSYNLLSTASQTSASLPGSQNYFRMGGGTQITGSGQVDGLGQWAYLAVFADTDVPDNTYGGLGDGSFRYRFRYDYF